MKKKHTILDLNLICARKVWEGSAGSYIANFEQYGTTE